MDLGYFLFIVSGLKYNSLIAVTSFVTGLALAIAIILVDEAVIKARGRITRFYSYVFTGIPPLVIISIMYWLVLPSLGVRSSPLIAAIMAFSLRTSAFQAMILKSTINSLDESQVQGGLSLGLSVREVYAHLVIPQAVILSIPSLTNELASLLKESTQALAIGVLDMLARARYVTIATGYSLLWLGITGIIMYLLSNSLTLTARYLQRKGLFPGTSRDLLTSPGTSEKNYGKGAKQNRLKGGLLTFMSLRIKRQSL